MLNFKVDKFLHALAHDPNATDEIKKQYVQHVKQQRIHSKWMRENRKIYEQDKDALNSILEYRMQMEAIATCTDDDDIIKAAQVIIALIDNSLNGSFCGSGDAKYLEIMLAAFELIKTASISGVIKHTESATRAENFILRKAIEEGKFEILEENNKSIKIKMSIDTEYHTFSIPQWYFNYLSEDSKYSSIGKKFSGGKKYILGDKKLRKRIADVVRNTYFKEFPKRGTIRKSKIFAYDAAENEFQEIKSENPDLHLPDSLGDSNIDHYWDEFYQDRPTEKTRGNSQAGKPRGKSKKTTDF